MFTPLWKAQEGEMVGLYGIHNLLPVALSSLYPVETSTLLYNLYRYSSCLGVMQWIRLPSEYVIYLKQSLSGTEQNLVDSTWCMLSSLTKTIEAIVYVKEAVYIIHWVIYKMYFSVLLVWTLTSRFNKNFPQKMHTQFCSNNYRTLLTFQCSGVK